MSLEIRNKRIIQALDHVFSYASDVDDWLVIKKEILKCLSPVEKILFSTRDPKTKKQRTNNLERLPSKTLVDKNKKARGDAQ